MKPWMMAAAAGVAGFLLGGFTDYGFQMAGRAKTQQAELTATKERLAEIETNGVKPQIFEVTKGEIALLHRKGHIMLDERGNVLAIKKEAK